MSNSKRKNRATPQNHASSRQQQIMLHQESSYSGPIPPPAVLDQYEKVLPGSAERILQMAEAQGEHRRKCEKTSVEAAAKEVSRGQIFAFIIALLIMVLSAYMIYTGNIVTGLIVLFTDLAVMLGSSYLTRPKS